MDHTIVHFEIPVDDTARAKAFYENVFGWQIQQMPGPFEYFGVRTTAEVDEHGLPKGHGANGGMYKRSMDCQKPVNYFGVEDIDAHAAKVVEAGGEITMPKMAVPGHGWMVQFKDPEGNHLALWQGDRNAA